MKKLLRWFVANSPLMVLALILSSLAWVVATEEENPTVTQRYPQPIPVELTNLPERLVIVGEFEEQVQVTLRAPQSVWDVLAPEDVSAIADLTTYGPGVHRVPVDILLGREPARVLEFAPEHVEIQLEALAEETVPVQVRLEGEPALGYLQRTPSLTPREVTAVGPDSYVAQVTAAAAAVAVEGAEENVETVVSLRPVDGEGQTVPYIALSPTEVEVRVPIELSSYYRLLAIKVVPEGQVAPGYRIASISVEPPTVMVFGAPDVVSALPGFIETEPVNVEGAQEDVIQRPVLALPNNVSVVTGQQPLEVQVDVDAVPGSRTVEVTPTVQGLGPGLTATVSPETVEVILSGPAPEVEALEPRAVRVVLDLFDLGEGEHQVEPQAVLPGDLTAQSILPSTVRVEIAREPERGTNPLD
jgi:YbbR domain-containing protein